MIEFEIYKATYTHMHAFSHICTVTTSLQSTLALQRTKFSLSLN